MTSASIQPIPLQRSPITRCSLSQVLRWAGVGTLADAQTDAISYAVRKVAAGDALLVEGRPLHHLYCVVAGSVKSTQTDGEGYEQVLDFALQGDLLGLDALDDGTHASGAIALQDGAVAALPYAPLIEASRTVPAIEQLLLHGAGRELAQRSRIQYLLSAPSSEVRVARFLLQFGRRQADRGQSERRLRLPMTRRDIASCLGVAHESISRALGALAQAGCIAVSRREVQILDVDALREWQRVTRGAPRGRVRRDAEDALAA